MSSSICRFMPAKDYTDSIKTVNFVYETELKKLPDEIELRLQYEE